MGESPFLKHRQALLGMNTTNKFLGDIVLALYGSHEISLGSMRRLDAGQRAIMQECMEWYQVHGESDPDFMDLAMILRQRETWLAKNPGQSWYAEDHVR